MRIGAHRVGHYSEMLRCRLTYRHRRDRRWEKARTAGSPFFRTSTLRAPTSTAASAHPRPQL